jgi:hypothetical protein
MSYATALQVAQLTLSERRQSNGQPLKKEEIAAQVDEILKLPTIASGVDREALIRDLEERFTIWSDEAQILHGIDDHKPWLAARRSDFEWPFWKRYRLFIGKTLSPAVVDNVDKVTDDILGELEDPAREGVWDRRGLVMGNVQSGKTGNYTGLICKAADTGYKVIVVLAGLHNNLRSQTQVRLDEGFLGYKSVAPRSGGTAFEKTGVGLLDPRAKADSVTNRGETGDFNRTVAAHFAIHPGGNPLLFVVKKNVSVLRNLLGWIGSSADGVDADTGRRYHKSIPLLVIDDEADQASVDTNTMTIDSDGNPDEEHDPTRINELIRRLLIAFDKSAYVGYTATPFANIFIHEKAKTKDLGEDLFPRSFIINLPAPSNYTGAARIFGVRDENGIGLTESDPLPIIRPVSDHAASESRGETSGWMPPRLVARTGHIPLVDGERRVPPSLRKAILCFLLSTVVRGIREAQPQLNSMLIHVVRFTLVQEIVREEVENELTSIRNRLLHGDGKRKPTIVDELKELWETDYMPTSLVCGMALPSWPEVQHNLTRAASMIQVRIINGSAKDALDYEEHRESGLSLIAVGGDKLSRGLTLEGLTVSYFLRSSKMYDTLMQMGRWFGYREDYVDLCRLYTTSELVSWFAHIASATEELRMEFDYMFSIGATPRDYGLKIRAHPALLVTSAVKMRTGTSMRLSYSGDISETIIFDRTEDKLRANHDAVIALISQLGAAKLGGAVGGYLWTGCSVNAVIEFLTTYQSHPDALRADTRLLQRYIGAQTEQGELTEWSVFIASSGRAGISWKNAEDLGIGHVGLIDREPYPADTNTRGRYSIRRLVSPVDEARDLSDEERKRAMEETIRLWNESTRKNKSQDPPTELSGRAIRIARPKTRGLLIIYPLDGTVANLEPHPPVMGIALSFPKSDTAREIEYTVNNVFTESGDYDSL